MYVFINIEYGAMIRTKQQLYNDNSIIKKIYMLNQHNLLWICWQSLCSIKREFLQIMATTQHNTNTDNNRPHTGFFAVFKKKLFVFAATFYNSFCAVLFMFLDHLLWYFFNIIFFPCYFTLIMMIMIVVCFGYVAVRIMGEKNDNMSKKNVLFRPVNNRLKSVKFTKMFSVQCSNRVWVLMFTFILLPIRVLCMMLRFMYICAGIVVSKLWYFFFQIPYSWMVCFLICWQKHFLSLNRHQKA